MGGIPDRAEGVMVEYIDRDAFIEQKRKQYCSDCNRRKGMKNGKYKTLYEIGEAPCRACEIDDVLNDVEDFPAADVRPVVMGEFVRCGDGKGVPYMCSHCGRTTPANMVEIWGVNYCPNCGADMREKS